MKYLVIEIPENYVDWEVYTDDFNFINKIGYWIQITVDYYPYETLPISPGKWSSVVMISKSLCVHQYNYTNDYIGGDDHQSDYYASFEEFLKSRRLLAFE